ncbi:lipopolysaccharide biosynthesis protein [Methylocystis heyeri]|uniref:Lipopolysaccharide biosynthesis protein n=2 Tax=Methylocystis heyeri TaxID=391905 RepID=A0A6B8KLK4_9HYPH|nr:lipopolysaccharide biosynthesis protein [Methylocystis heyeri]
MSDRGVTGEIDLSHILRALSEKRWWILGPTIAAFLSALVFVNVVKPRYTAESRVLLENQENFLPRSEKNDRATEILPDAEAVQSQIQVLTSRDLARRVIKTLGLQGDVEFDPLANGMGLATRAMVLLGLMRDPTQLTPEERILETFADRLNVLSPTKTRILSIEFSSRNPDLAARGANAVAEAYIEFQQQAKRDNAGGAAKTLAALVAELRKQVAEADLRAEQFRVKSGLLVGSNNTTINTQHLSELNTQLSLARTAQADAQAKAKLLREMLRQNRIGDIPDVANNEVFRRLLEQRVTLRAQLALESRTLLPGHPRIKELQAQLGDLDAQGRAVAERIARSLENDARIAGARVENLKQTLDAQKQVVGSSEADEVQLRELERSVRLYREQLESATAKYQEALARENAQATPADARIVQRALAPQAPSFPKKIPITAFAALAALILSSGAIISGELLSGRARVVPPAPGETPARPRSASLLERFSFGDARRADDPTSRPSGAVESDRFVSESAAEPFAAIDEDEDEDEEAVDASEEKRIASERDIIGGIDAARMTSSCVKVLAVSGDASGVASGTILALARGLSRRGRAVLIYADQNEILDRQLDPDRPVASGLRELLAGEADFAEIIRRDPGSRLHFIPSGLEGEADGEEMEPVLEALARTYDFVILTVNSAADALGFAPLFDKVLLRDGDPVAHKLFDLFARSHGDVQLIEDAAGDAVAA